MYFKYIQWFERIQSMIDENHLTFKQEVIDPPTRQRF